MNFEDNEIPSEDGGLRHFIAYILRFFYLLIHRSIPI